MDLTLSQEQRDMRDTVRRFAHDVIAPVAVSYEREGIYPEEIVQGMAAMGLFGMLVPTEYHGLELDTVTYSLVFEELSRVWMGVAGILGSHTLATNMLRQAGTEEQRRRFLPDLAAGTRKSGIGLTEPDAGSDLQGIRTTAERRGNVYVLNGSKMWITNARHADPLPVLVKTDPQADPPHKGMSVLLVEAETPGVSITRDLGKLGYKGPESCEIVFDNAEVPSENLLGDVEGRGLQQALRALEVGRINIAARAVGVAQAALDAALTYARQRQAFGRSIGEFQAIQLKLADMATRIEAGRLLNWSAALTFDQGERADKISGMAKVFCSEVALECTLESMRIHGGYGYSTEFPVERYYRDAPLMAIGEGTNDILRMVVARRLLADVDAGRIP